MWCRYEYLGASHDWHGGVKVTYKDRLSRVETSSTAEWSPIDVITVPGPTPGAATRKKEVTNDRGVRFIPHPPDLRKEPARGAWEEDKPKQGEGHQCTAGCRRSEPTPLAPTVCFVWQPPTFVERS
jgi:hypothetical protein